MVEILTAFAGKFVFVYLLSRQTLIIVHGKPWQAFFVSLLIGVAEIFVIRAVVIAVETGNSLVYVAAIFGGSCGVACAMLSRRP